jgi:hypothetical protein
MPMSDLGFFIINLMRGKAMPPTMKYQRFMLSGRLF